MEMMSSRSRNLEASGERKLNAFTPGAKHVIAPSARATDRHDIPTISAVAVIVYALASVLHEGIGHGGACLLVGATPLEISSMTFTCDAWGWASRVVSAGGSIATLAGGGIALALYLRKSGPPIIKYALWLFAAINLMMGFGYFLYSGVANVGDWAAVIADVRLHWLWRLLLTAVGGYAYYRVTLYLFPILDPLIGEARPRRYEHGARLAVRAYLAGGILEMLAGVFNAGGPELLLISGAAATFGGTCGLLWGPQYLRGVRTPSDKLEEPVDIVRRNWVAIGIAAVVAIAFIATLGPGVTINN